MATTQEIVRYEVRRHLYERQMVSQDAATIHRNVSRREPCTLDDVEAALKFLADLGQVNGTPDSLGSTLYYSITAQGILAEERL